MKIKYVCRVCREESWFDVNLETYIISDADLICDGCLDNEERNHILDKEDVNFLEDLIEELPKIDAGVYKTEAVELENILFRLRL